jgi:hypothetical protein
MAKLNIDKIKNDKKLRPYFLWCIKCAAPFVAKFSAVGSSIIASDPHLIINYTRSTDALRDRLHECGVELAELDEVIVTVTEYLIGELGTDEIVAQNPELLILDEGQKN